MRDYSELSCEETAEIMRKKSRYRELILSGRLVLPHSRAAQLVGPDCLYHLYSARETGTRGKRVRKLKAEKAEKPGSKNNRAPGKD